MRAKALIAVAVAALAAAAPAGAGKDDVRRAVCASFGSRCDEAMSVVSCETGGTYDPWASNGQYLGLFQMGRYARGRYGHSTNAWGQARAAYRYFVDSGRDWSPWQCRPGGGLAW